MSFSHRALHHTCSDQAKAKIAELQSEKGQYLREIATAQERVQSAEHDAVTDQLRQVQMLQDMVAQLQQRNAALEHQAQAAVQAAAAASAVSAASGQKQAAAAPVAAVDNEALASELRVLQRRIGELVKVHSDICRYCVSSMPCRARSHPVLTGKIRTRTTAARCTCLRRRALIV